MKLLIVVLNRLELLEDLLTALVEVGVGGATVLESVGMGRLLAHNVPIFAGLAASFPGSSPGNKTILSVIEDELVESVARVVEDVCGPFDKPGTGLLITLPVDNLLGFRSGLGD